MRFARRWSSAYVSRSPWKHERDGVRRPRRLRAEELVDAGGGVRRFRAVPRLQHQGALVRRQERQPLHGPVLIRRHLLQRPPQVRREALHGGAVEERRGVVQPAGDAPVVLPQGQRQVELGRVLRGSAPRPPGQPRQLQGAARRVLPGEHHLEERGYARLRAGRSRSTTCSNGMSWCCCASSAAARTCASSSATRGRARQVHAQGQRVDEEADQRLRLAPRPRFAVGVPTTTSACPASRAEHGRPARQQRHEQRGAVPPRQRLERRRQLPRPARWAATRRRSPAARARDGPWAAPAAPARRRATAPRSAACRSSSSPSTRRRCQAA